MYQDKNRKKLMFKNMLLNMLWISLSIVVFYLLLLFIGTRRRKKLKSDSDRGKKD